MARDRLLRVGVVGIGFGQQVHVPAFRADERCVVGAICASRLDRAQAVAARLGIPKAYGGWQALVRDPEIDAVAIATPPAVQPAIVLASLARGKHVFCEKPLAEDLKTAAKLLRAARRARAAHMVDLEFLVLETWREAKQFLAEGRLGEVRHASISWHVETAANRVDVDSWKTDPRRGGGALSLFVSHTFAYVEWLLGPVARLSARLFVRGRSAHLRRADTLAILCLEGSCGVPVSVVVSNNAFHGSGHRVEVYGDEGSLTLENSTSDYLQGFQLSAHRRAESQPILLQEPTLSGGADGRIGAVSRLAKRYVDWALTGCASGPSFEDGYRVQQLMHVAIISSRSGRAVRVPPRTTLTASNSGKRAGGRRHGSGRA